LGLLYGSRAFAPESFMRSCAGRYYFVRQIGDRIMAITKQKKQELVVSMKKRLADAKSLVFVNFKALSVAESKMLRRKLSAEHVGYFVAKKTLAKRVLGDLKVSGEMPELTGELSIAYGKDLLAPARETYAFQKTVRDKGSITIMGGVFDGVYKTQAEMVQIALVPPLQVLRGQFVNLINSPIQRLAIVMEEIYKSKETKAI
jgi:large subunit ribosomal protein L10